jgi:cyclophilin family peptidyl-prolyl cis-trans isomerase
MKTLLMLAAAAVATPAPKPALAPSEIVAAAPKADWVAIAPSDLLVMDLANGKRVVIQLMPPPFSQGWIGNVRKLAAARFWDGTSINRVQDNYVVQWGDANGEDKAKAKVLPAGLEKVPQDAYLTPVEIAFLYSSPVVWPDPPVTAHKQSDQYAKGVGFVRGWPIGLDGLPPPGPSQRPFKKGDGRNYWPVHCYGMVGVGRDMPPDTGTGAELYTVIGHAPRHLDRNIALVGRVISGIENLSSLPRGTGPLGFYEKPEERVGITSIRIGTEVKDLTRFEYLSTESASFATYADARANRRDPFFIQPAGGADICNIPVPVRMVK